MRLPGVRISVEDKANKKDETNMLAAIAKVGIELKFQEEPQEEGRQKIEKEEFNIKHVGLNTAVESIDGGGEKMTNKRKRDRKALREASPACDYERIRAANIAERMELLRTLDIEGALAGLQG